MRITKEDHQRMLKLIGLTNELCCAIENAEEDIGGSRPIKEIIGDIGPAVDKLIHLLDVGR